MNEGATHLKRAIAQVIGGLIPTLVIKEVGKTMSETIHGWEWYI